jgi:uncharacterized ion transporter superfamily protein YfcC
MSTTDSAPKPAQEDSSVSTRQQALARVKNRRDFGAHLVAYVVINAFLIMIWAVTGAGYFWPVWILAGWGAGLVMHAWTAFIQRPITEADIDAELRRLS